MEVGDLVRLTTNEQQGLGVVISKKKQTNPAHWIYRVQWANGRITTGGSYYMEVINESR